MIDKSSDADTEGADLPEHEPTTREINRRLQVERAEEKLLANLMRRGLSTGKELLREVVSRWPGELDKQSEFFYDAIDLFGPGRKPKLLGYDAKQRVRADFQNVLHTLDGTHSEVTDLSDLTTERVLVAVALWCERGLSAGTIQSKVSVLRRFLVLIGEPGAVPLRDKFEALLRAHGVETERVRRRQQRPAPLQYRRFS